MVSVGLAGGQRVGSGRVIAEQSCGFFKEFPGGTRNLPGELIQTGGDRAAVGSDGSKGLPTHFQPL